MSHFAPFDGRSENQTAILAKKVVSNVETLGIEMTSFEAPVSFASCFHEWERQLSQVPEEKDVVCIALGEAPIPSIQMELLAVNKRHAPSRGDNEGLCPYDEPLVLESPLALETSFNARQVQKWMQSKNVEMALSYSAGQYVCNCLYYQLLQRQNNWMQAVFFHVPIEMNSERLSHCCQVIELFLEAKLKGAL